MSVRRFRRPPLQEATLSVTLSVNNGRENRAPAADISARTGRTRHEIEAAQVAPSATGCLFYHLTIVPKIKACALTLLFVSAFAPVTKSKSP
jgi:hypothetical protein